MGGRKKTPGSRGSKESRNQNPQTFFPVAHARSTCSCPVAHAPATKVSQVSHTVSSVSSTTPLLPSQSAPCPCLAGHCRASATVAGVRPPACPPWAVRPARRQEWLRGSVGRPGQAPGPDSARSGSRGQAWACDSAWAIPGGFPVSKGVAYARASMRSISGSRTSWRQAEMPLSGVAAS